MFLSLKTTLHLTLIATLTWLRLSSLCEKASFCNLSNTQKEGRKVLSCLIVVLTDVYLLCQGLRDYAVSMQ